MTKPTPPPPGSLGRRERLSIRMASVGEHHKVRLVAAVCLFGCGVIWAGMVSGAVASLHLSAAQANGGGAAAGMDSVITPYVGYGLAALGLLLFAHRAGGISWASLRMRRSDGQDRSDGQGQSDGQGRIFCGALGTVVLYFAAMVVAAQVFKILSSRQAGGPRGHPGMDTPNAQLLPGDIISGTFGGGICEELTLLAIPVAVFTALVPLKTMNRTGRCASWSALVAALLAARWAIHLYYGWIPSLHVLVWAAAAVALFLASGTIWPLMLAHSLYDAAAFTAARIPATNAAITWLFSTVAVAGVAVAAGTAKRWRNRTRQTRPNLLTSGGEI